MEFNLLEAVTHAKQAIIDNNIAFSTCDVSEDENGVVTLRLVVDRKESVDQFRFDGKRIEIDSTESYFPDEVLELDKFVRNEYDEVFSEEEYFQEAIEEYVLSQA